MKNRGLLLGLIWSISLLASASATAAEATTKEGSVPRELQLDIFDNGIPLVKADLAHEFCQNEWVQVAMCIAVECPDFEAQCPLAFVWSPEQDFGFDLSCEAIEFAFCTVYNGPDCCMHSCYGALTELIQCVTLAENEDMAAEDVSLPCDAPECPVDAVLGSPSNNENENDEDESDYFALPDGFFDDLILPVVQEPLVTAEETCPGEFGAFGGCVALGCSNYANVCPMLPTTDTNDESTAVSKQMAAFDCASIETKICKAYEEDPDCCLVKCLEQLNELVVCLVNAAPMGEPFLPLSCNEPQCSNSASDSSSSMSVITTSATLDPATEEEEPGVQFMLPNTTAAATANGEMNGGVVAAEETSANNNNNADGSTEAALDGTETSRAMSLLTGISLSYGLVLLTATTFWSI